MYRFPRLINYGKLAKDILCKHYIIIWFIIILISNIINFIDFIDVPRCVTFINDSTLGAYTDAWLDDRSLLMDGGSNPGGGSNPEGGPSGGQGPGGNGPEGSNHQIQDSTEVRKRKRMARELENLLNTELANRSSLGPRFANRVITITDLDIVRFRRTDSILPSSVTGLARDILEYRKDFPDAFNSTDNNNNNGPGTTLVANLIHHLNNNSN